VGILRDIEAFNEFFGARITCLHVSSKSNKVPEDQDQLRELESKFADSKSEIKFAMVMDEDVENAIFSYAYNVDANILAMFAQDHGPMGSFFHDSMTKSMSMHTELPLLVLKK